MTYGREVRYHFKLAARRVAGLFQAVPRVDGRVSSFRVKGIKFKMRMWRATTLCLSLVRRRIVLERRRMPSGGPLCNLPPSLTKRINGGRMRRTRMECTRARST